MAANLERLNAELAKAKADLEWARNSDYPNKVRLIGSMKGRVTRLEKKVAKLANPAN